MLPPEGDIRDKMTSSLGNQTRLSNIDKGLTSYKKDVPGGSMLLLTVLLNFS